MRNLKKSPHNIGIALAFSGIVVAGVFSFVSPEVAIQNAENNSVAQATDAKVEKDHTVPNDVTHLETPEPLYAIYMSQCVVGTPSFRDSLVSMIEETELNSVIIDIKDYSGTIAFRTKDPRLSEASLTNCGAGDMKAFIRSLNDKGIYTIGRITVFQDPHYSERFPEQAVQSVSRPGEPWEDHKGLSFVDVSSKPFWDYIVQLSKESYAIGFDELNFDYIRYPSDGPMSDAKYINPNKAVALEEFFKYLHSELEPYGIVTSADLFGYTTVLTDDLGIGQQLERTLPYFDYVAPMVYPSHYNKGFAGLSNPNSDPYKVIFTSMAKAVQRALSEKSVVKTFDGEPIFEEVIVPATLETATTTKQVFSGYYTKPVHDKLALRPWLQDFDYGKDYTVEDINAQIQATYDAGLTSWMFWDPANRYENVDAYLRTRKSQEVE